MTQNIKIDETLKENIKDFFSGIDISYPSGLMGYASLNNPDILTTCLIHQMQTSENILREYIFLSSKLNEYSSIHEVISFYDSCYCGTWEEAKEHILSDLEKLLNYKGYWKIPKETLEVLYRAKQELETMDENPYEVKRKQEARSEILDKYYDYTFVECAKETEQIKQAILNADPLPLAAFTVAPEHYPILLTIYDAHKNVVNLLKVERNIEGRIAKLMEKYPNYKYSYILVDKKIIDHAWATLSVYFNPRDLSSNVFANRQSPYKSLNTVKTRFKFEAGIDLRVIKKVCSLYNVPIYHLNNANTVINRNEINQALSEYMGKDFTKHPNAE